MHLGGSFVCHCESVTLSLKIFLWWHETGRNFRNMNGKTRGDTRKNRTLSREILCALTQGLVPTPWSAKRRVLVTGYKTQCQHKTHQRLCQFKDWKVLHKNIQRQIQLHSIICQMFCCCTLEFWFVLQKMWLVQFWRAPNQEICLLICLWIHLSGTKIKIIITSSCFIQNINIAKGSMLAVTIRILE